MGSLSRAVWLGESHIVNMHRMVSDLAFPVAVKMICLKKGTKSFSDLEGISALADMVSMWGVTGWFYQDARHSWVRPASCTLLQSLPQWNGQIDRLSPRCYRHSSDSCWWFKLVLCTPSWNELILACNIWVRPVNKFYRNILKLLFVVMYNHKRNSERAINAQCVHSATKIFLLEYFPTHNTCEISSVSSPALGPIPRSLKVTPNAQSTNGMAHKSRHLLNLFVFIIDIDLPAAIMHLWTFFCKRSAGGSFYRQIESYG